jgi:hypothetical protein
MNPWRPIEFNVVAIHGHVPGLQWAEAKSLDCFSTEVIFFFAFEQGSISILEWIQSRGKVIPVGKPAGLRSG